MKNPNCKDCLWGVEDGWNDKHWRGKCHYLPPLVDKDGFSFYPKVSADHWCAQFKTDFTLR
jgi:hypothetical protein